MVVALPRLIHDLQADEAEGIRQGLVARLMASNHLAPPAPLSQRDHKGAARLASISVHPGSRPQPRKRRHLNAGRAVPSLRERSVAAPESHHSGLARKEAKRSERSEELRLQLHLLREAKKAGPKRKRRRRRVSKRRQGSKLSSTERHNVRGGDLGSSKKRLSATAGPVMQGSRLRELAASEANGVLDHSPIKSDPDYRWRSSSGAVLTQSLRSNVSTVWGRSRRTRPSARTAAVSPVHAPQGQLHLQSQPPAQLNAVPASVLAAIQHSPMRGLVTAAGNRELGSPGSSTALALALARRSQAAIVTPGTAMGISTVTANRRWAPMIDEYVIVNRGDDEDDASNAADDADGATLDGTAAPPPPTVGSSPDGAAAQLQAAATGSTLSLPRLGSPGATGSATRKREHRLGVASAASSNTSSPTLTRVGTAASDSRKASLPSVASRSKVPPLPVPTGPPMASPGLRSAEQRRQDMFAAMTGTGGGGNDSVMYDYRAAVAAEASRLVDEEEIIRHLERRAAPAVTVVMGAKNRRQRVVFNRPVSAARRAAVGSNNAGGMTARGGALSHRSDLGAGANGRGSPVTADDEINAVLALAAQVCACVWRGSIRSLLCEMLTPLCGNDITGVTQRTRQGQSDSIWHFVLLSSTAPAQEAAARNHQGSVCVYALCRSQVRTYAPSLPLQDAIRSQRKQAAVEQQFEESESRAAAIATLAEYQASQRNRKPSASRLALANATPAATAAPQAPAGASGAVVPAVQAPKAQAVPEHVQRALQHLGSSRDMARRGSAAGGGAVRRRSLARQMTKRGLLLAAGNQVSSRTPRLPGYAFSSRSNATEADPNAPVVGSQRRAQILQAVKRAHTFDPVEYAQTATPASAQDHVMHLLQTTTAGLIMSPQGGGGTARTMASMGGAGPHTATSSSPVPEQGSDDGTGATPLQGPAGAPQLATPRALPRKRLDEIRRQLAGALGSRSFRMSQFLHVDGCEYCKELYGHYTLPNGSTIHYYFDDDLTELVQCFGVVVVLCT